VTVVFSALLLFIAPITSSIQLIHSSGLVQTSHYLQVGDRRQCNGTFQNMRRLMVQKIGTFSKNDLLQIVHSAYYGAYTLQNVRKAQRDLGIDLVGDNKAVTVTEEVMPILSINIYILSYQHHPY
jgi:hypothetical protein